MTAVVRRKHVSCTDISLPQQQAVTLHNNSAFFTGEPFFRSASGRGRGGRNKKLKALNLLVKRNMYMAA